MSAGEPGRRGVLEVKPGGSSGAAAWTDITGSLSRFDGFAHSIVKGEFSNAGAGSTTHQHDGHAEGDGSFTISDTVVSRPLFWGAHGTRMGFRWSPEGKTAGTPNIVMDAFVNLSKPAAAGGAIRYAVTLTIEEEPTRGAN